MISVLGLGSTEDFEDATNQEALGDGLFLTRREKTARTDGMTSPQSAAPVVVAPTEPRVDLNSTPDRNQMEQKKNNKKKKQTNPEQRREKKRARENETKEMQEISHSLGRATSASS